MTQEQTRQLGIEFERRVQTMIPEKEFINKLDTETIYSFINQYQDKFVHDIYKSLSTISSQKNISAYIDTILSCLTTTNRIYISQKNSFTKTYIVDAPKDYGLYLNSFTEVSDSYKKGSNEENSGILQNKFVAAADAEKFISKPYDSLRILRNPIVYMTGDKINLICDAHTTPNYLNITYYRQPQYANPLTSTTCELPIEAFDDIVTGAVDLYVQYVAGAEANKRRQDEARREQSGKRNNEDKD